MKKICFILISFALISCSSDNSDSTPVNTIIGKWYEHKKVKYYSDGTIHSETLNSSEPCYGMTTYEYKSNGQFIKDSYDNVNSECIQNPLRTGNWLTADNTLNIYLNNSTDIYFIDYLDDNKLLLKKNTPSDPQSQYYIIEYKKVN